MAVSNYEELAVHVGHQVVVASYGTANVAVECTTCATVLLDFDRPVATHGEVLDHDHGARTGPHRHDPVTGAWIGAAAASLRLVGAVLSIQGPLSEPQFRRLEELTGRQPERFKGWAQSFHFGLPLDGDPTHQPAVGYAQEQGLTFRLEITSARP
jgi:hypothetical protein